MIDGPFIEQILSEGDRAKAKALDAFTGLSIQQLNWKPNPKSWSIAQCLEHLIISDKKYFPDLQKIAQKQFAMTFWEKHSPFTAFFGRTMKGQLQEQVKRKMTAPKNIRPSSSDKGADILDNYVKNLDAFLNHMSACRHADVDKTVITSPIMSMITYTLRDAFTFLMQHEHRHLNQAIRVKEQAGFPKNSA